MKELTWEGVLARMTEVMRAHPDWEKFVVGTPLENDLPVRAALAAFELVQEKE